MRFTVASTLVAASFVAGQTTHMIQVGAGSLTFNPSNISAVKGDIVSFTFMAKNHSATQSTFAAPCTQLDNTTVTPPVIGISSGFMAVPPNATQFPSWNIQVQDSTPLWFFCLQADHCKQGMVFSINATPEKSHDAYLAAAKATTGNSTAAPQTNGAQTPPGGNAASGNNGGSSTGGSATAGAGGAAGAAGAAAAGSTTAPGSTGTNKPGSGAILNSKLSMATVMLSTLGAVVITVL